MISRNEKICLVSVTASQQLNTQMSGLNLTNQKVPKIPYQIMAPVNQSDEWYQFTLSVTLVSIGPINEEYSWYLPSMTNYIKTR